jgi:hypothetical protein
MSSVDEPPNETSEYEKTITTTSGATVEFIEDDSVSLQEINISYDTGSLDYNVTIEDKNLESLDFTYTTSAGTITLNSSTGELDISDGGGGDYINISNEYPDTTITFNDVSGNSSFNYQVTIDNKQLSSFYFSDTIDTDTSGNFVINIDSDTGEIKVTDSKYSLTVDIDDSGISVSAKAGGGQEVINVYQNSDNYTCPFVYTEYGNNEIDISFNKQIYEIQLTGSGGMGGVKGYDTIPSIPAINFDISVNGLFEIIAPIDTNLNISTTGQTYIYKPLDPFSGNPQPLSLKFLDPSLNYSNGYFSIEMSVDTGSGWRSSTINLASEIDSIQWFWNSTSGTWNTETVIYFDIIVSAYGINYNIGITFEGILNANPSLDSTNDVSTWMEVTGRCIVNEDVDGGSTDSFTAYVPMVSCIGYNPYYTFTGGYLTSKGKISINGIESEFYDNIIIFTNTGTFSTSIDNMPINYIIVGGGGGGGFTILDEYYGGGGGGGDVSYNYFTSKSNTTYTITVGNAGTTSVEYGGSSSISEEGTDFLLNVMGGAIGDSGYVYIGGNGGSSGNGYLGGLGQSGDESTDYGGGGGGYMGPGENATSSGNGEGGPGISISIPGFSVTNFGAGGKGGKNGDNGAANSGTGGQGMSGTGGSGGSGVVVFYFNQYYNSEYYITTYNNPIITSGNISINGKSKGNWDNILIFQTSGVFFTKILPKIGLIINYIMVGGGGPGASSENGSLYYGGGGGGADVSFNSFTANSFSKYDITVGVGGTPSVNGGSAGGSSSITQGKDFSLIVMGGNPAPPYYGDSSLAYDSEGYFESGGSSGNGNPGGEGDEYGYAGGGGGYMGPGVNATDNYTGSNSNGVGGPGISISVPGFSVTTFGAGGDGGGDGDNGTPNSGSGGNGWETTGGSGGSGVVILYF